MSRFIPYLSEGTIERDVAALLAEYANARGLTIDQRHWPTDDGHTSVDFV